MRQIKNYKKHIKVVLTCIPLVVAVIILFYETACNTSELFNTCNLGYVIVSIPLILLLETLKYWPSGQQLIGVFFISIAIYTWIAYKVGDKIEKLNKK
jgi:hypothetical protein